MYNGRNNMDDLDLDLSNEDENINSRNNNRFTTLTEKVKTEAKGRAEAETKLAEAEARALAAEKEKDFLSSFTDSTAKYPGAIEYKDQIKEKVINSGYDVEDATISVLAREGKLNTPPAPRESPAGGSAVNTMKGMGDKTFSEMTRDEKRQALIEADISLS